MCVAESFFFTKIIRDRASLMVSTSRMILLNLELQKKCIALNCWLWAYKSNHLQIKDKIKQQKSYLTHSQHIQLECKKKSFWSKFNFVRFSWRLKEFKFYKWIWIVHSNSQKWFSWAFCFKNSVDSLTHFNIQSTLDRSSRQGHGYEMCDANNFFSRKKLHLSAAEFLMSKKNANRKFAE